MTDNKIQPRINGYLVLQDLSCSPSSEAGSDLITVNFLRYADELHYNQCCVANDHDSSAVYSVTIYRVDFVDWIEKFELNISYEDGFDPFTNYGHTQIRRELEFSEYLAEGNIRKYISEGNKFCLSIEL